ncbi:MAG: DsrE family protein [Saprospiraceae bacterium]|nr:DsrE family protein [Candidatus Opimibacter iunctus]
MRNFILLTGMLFITTLVNAQNESTDVDLAQHKIVFQLTSADTNVHKMLVRQLGNVLAAAPNSTVEVVCHGPGIAMLTTKQTIVQPKIIELKGKGIQFVVCENTMRERKVTKEEIIPEAGFVKAGIIEIVKKQEEGWSYIRAGQ